MKLTQVLMVVAVTVSVGLSATPVFAQNDGGGQPQRGQAPGDQAGGGRGQRNFDPAEMQRQIMERTKERLEITDEGEWKALEPLVQKVVDARRETISALGRGMFGGRGNRGGGDAGGGGLRGGLFGTPSPEAEALQKAIDAKASNAEMKAALAKYVESRKAKQAALEKAQAELRKVLTPRQEAIAALNGLL